MMCLIIITFAASNLQSFLWLASDWMVSTILPAVIVSDTNEERGRAGLVSLSRNEILDQAAQMKAEDMANGSYFSHYSPTGISPWYWFKQAGYNYVHAGENLAVHFTDSSEVVDAWMNSPTHRANIMDEKFQEIGIGVAKGTYENYSTVFVVQLFGTASANLSSNNDTEVSDQLSLVDETGTEETVESESTIAPVVAGVETGNIENTSLSDEMIDITDQGTVVMSSYISTSTGGIPATIDSSNQETKKPVMAFATQPQTVMQFFYIVIGLFVAVSLILSIVIEIRHQQPVQMVYGIGLLVLMLVLFHVHISISGGVLVI